MFTRDTGLGRGPLWRRASNTPSGRPAYEHLMPSHEPPKRHPSIPSLQPRPAHLVPALASLQRPVSRRHYTPTEFRFPLAVVITRGAQLSARTLTSGTSHLPCAYLESAPRRHWRLRRIRGRTAARAARHWILPGWDRETLPRRRARWKPPR
jgi:hypothetical protein